MNRGNLYVKVDRIQSHGEHQHLKVVHSYKPTHLQAWHHNGVSSKDVFLEKKQHAEAMRLEFRL
jgi:hypothetical protein